MRILIRIDLICYSDVCIAGTWVRPDDFWDVRTLFAYPRPTYAAVFRGKHLDPL